MKNGEQERKLEYLDDLTGLYNRRYFRKTLVEEKRKADQKGSSFALMMTDLDNFKPINDLYGHLTGDKVLSQVGRLLKESLRPTDILCRYAGDEFVVILPETGDEEVIGVAERIKENFAQASWVDEKGEPIQAVTCSLGYAFYSEKGKDLEGLVGWADQALYAVKRRGGNGYCGEKELSRESIGRPLVSTPHLVGREKELRRLKSLLEAVHREGGRLVLIHGEVGVGKTRLVRELRQVLERRGGSVLLGACHEETCSIPYYPFWEAFNRFFQERKDEGLLMLENIPEYYQKELARILPGLKEMEPSELERAPDRFRLFEAVRLFLQTFSGQSKNPLLFIVEDLHWSDEASLDLLHYVARNLREARVLLCGTYRTEEAAGEERSSLLRFAGSLRREELSEEIILQPLSAQGVFAMVHLLFPRVKVSQEFQDFLYQKTEGNPFFVEELLKLLGEEEIEGGLSGIREVPQSIDAVLQRRIDSLAPGMKEILACGALVGKVFEFEVLRRVQDRPERDVLDAVEAGVKAYIIRESFEGGEERYHFVHSLMADVLYSGIGKVRRRLWHVQVGEALEDLYAGRLEQLNGRLVYHFELGKNWEKALNCALRSAKQAKEDYANQEAIRLYEKAREILPRLTRESEEERTAIAEGLGDVYQITGNYEKTLEEYRFVETLARRTGDEKKEGEALSEIGQVYQLEGNYDQMMIYAKKSYEIRKRIGDQKGLAESLNNLGNVHWSRGDYEDALKYYEESLKIRREIGDQRGLAQSLNNIGNVRGELGDYGEGLKCYEESLRIKREMGNKRGVAASLHNIGIVHAERGDYGEASKWYEESLKILRDIGDKGGLALSLNSIGIVHAERGEYGKALKCLQESLNIEREIGDKWGVALSLQNTGIVQWNRGDYEDALRCHEESLTIRREIGDRSGMAFSLNSIGIVEAERGDYGGALKRFEESLDIHREIRDKRGAASSLSNIGNVHWVQGDYGEALKYYEESLKFQREIGEKSGVAETLNNLGNIHMNCGDYGEALKCYEESLRIQREIGDRRGVAFSLLQMGTLHQGLYDIEKAMEYHKESLTLMGEMGMKAEKIRVQAEIGTDCHLSGDGEMALENLNEALDVVVELGIKDAEPGVLEALSEVWLSKENFAKADEFCERLLRMAEKQGLKRYIAIGRKIKGEILLFKANSKQIRNSKFKSPNKTAKEPKRKHKNSGSSASLRSELKRAESELKKAERIAEEIGALPLVWQIHASLGRLYEEIGDKKKASQEFKKAKKIVQAMASKVGDDKLRDIFLNSKQVQSLSG